MDAQSKELEAKGFYQEEFRALDARYSDFNYGVWQHRWHLNTGVPCAQCGSTDIALRVNETAFCLKCLNEYPDIPWHPTGAVIGKTGVFLRHALSCDQH